MKRIYLKLFCLTVVVILNGCTRDLDLSPRDTLSDASFWNTPSDFQRAANSLYVSLPGFALFDTDSDIAFNQPNSVSNSTWTTPETDNDNWNTRYTRIRNSNTLIDRATDSPIADDVKVYVAEAKFFRAFNYWLLYSRFGGVPLVTKRLDIDSPELYGARHTAKQTVDFILSDLQDAVADLPEENQVSAANKGRITKGAANALRARVALFEGSWLKSRGLSGANEYFDIAIAAANTVISSSQYSLFEIPGDNESYRKLFDEQGRNSSETILARRHERNIAGHAFPQSMQQNGLLPTKQLADMYLCMNGLPIIDNPMFQGYEGFDTEFIDRDPRMWQTIMIPGTVAYAALMADPVPHWPFNPNRVWTTGYINYKYVIQNPDYVMPPLHLQQNTHRIVIRYAEVLLILAEATFERFDEINDIVLGNTINLLRARAGLTTPLTNDFVTNNNLDMREEIRRERTVELALEGFRRDDLRRWKTAETELVKAIRGIKIVGTQWGTEPIIIGDTDRNVYSEPSWQNRTDAEGFIISETASYRESFDPEKHYLHPIPAREILLNQRLEQNNKW